MYEDFHYTDMTVMRLSYLYDGNPCTGKMTTLYWDGILVIVCLCDQNICEINMQMKMYGWTIMLLTLWGPVMPYGNIDQGQHWLR